MSVRGLSRIVFALAMTTAGPLAGAAEFAVDNVHSSVEFRVKHANTSYAKGRFNDVAGTFAFDEADPAKSNFHITIKTASVDTKAPPRDEHLKKDFFHSSEFPTITFKSKTVASAGQHMYEVTGDLTMHGVTKPVTVKIEHTGSGKDMKGKPTSGLATEFTIKRSEFNMKTWPGMIGEDVKVMVDLEGAAK